jgi:nucleoside-diphosphate-sugar epimerase
MDTTRGKDIAGTMDKNSRIIITGASGLLGQNTILLLCEKGYTNLLAIDVHKKNIAILRKLNPGLEVIEADLSERGDWQNAFASCDVLIQCHAKITGLLLEDFERDNETATVNVLEAAKKHDVPYIVHISSSVVIAVSDDFYTQTKKAQELLVDECGIKNCSLRPPLMFGWFDKKHLGWLSRLMTKIPVFPIPGNGNYLRQPLWAGDMAAVIIAAMEQQPEGKYNIIGRDEITYIDIIRRIKRVKGLKTVILRIPYALFKFLMDFYALFSKNPPFTSQQLAALTAGDYFTPDPWWDIFGVPYTPFDEALKLTFEHPEYSSIVLEP